MLMMMIKQLNVNDDETRLMLHLVYINISFFFYLNIYTGFLMVVHHGLDTKQTQLWFNRAHS